MKEQQHIDRARSWLQARFLGATEKEKPHDVVRAYDDSGPRTATGDDACFVRIHRQDFHAYLLSIGAPVAETIALCRTAGWIRVSEGGVDVRHLQPFYAIMPTVIAGSMPPTGSCEQGEGAGLDNSPRAHTPPAEGIVSVPEYIDRVIGLLEKAEAIRLTLERQLDAGADPSAVLRDADGCRLKQAKLYFGELAQPLVLVAYSRGIEAAPLDDFIRTGKPNLVAGAIRVLRMLQAYALTRSMPPTAKPGQSDAKGSGLAPDKKTDDAGSATPPTCVAEGEISECYTFRDLLRDLASVRVTNERAKALLEKSEGPASAFIEDPSKTYDIQSFRNYYAMAAAEFYSSASQQAGGLTKRPAVDRLRTLCFARAGGFSDIVLQQLCADAAVTAGKTLDDLLLLDTATVADLLQDQHEGSGGAGPTRMLVDRADTRVTDLDFQRKFMEMAVAEARKSKPEDGRVHPKVGVVVVRGGVVLATAYRGEMGPGDHAEFTALEKKLPDAVVAGSTVYTTLEPCTSRKHPKLPCASRLIERRVKRVVIGMHDPNPTVYGGGWARLREAGIATADFESDLTEEIKEMNRDFIRSQTEAGRQQGAKEGEG
jgi:pyrimidine deaminase RibD-like protein